MKVEFRLFFGMDDASGIRYYTLLASCDILIYVYHYSLNVNQ